MREANRRGAVGSGVVRRDQQHVDGTVSAVSWEKSHRRFSLRAVSGISHLIPNRFTYNWCQQIGYGDPNAVNVLASTRAGCVLMVFLLRNNCPTRTSKLIGTALRLSPDGCFATRDHRDTSKASGHCEGSGESHRLCRKTYSKFMTWTVKKFSSFVISSTHFCVKNFMQTCISVYWLSCEMVSSWMFTAIQPWHTDGTILLAYRRQNHLWLWRTVSNNAPSL